MDRIIDHTKREWLATKGHSCGVFGKSVTIEKPYLFQDFMINSCRSQRRAIFGNCFDHSERTPGESGSGFFVGRARLKSEASIGRKLNGVIGTSRIHYVIARSHEVATKQSQLICKIEIACYQRFDCVTPTNGVTPLSAMA